MNIGWMNELFKMSLKTETFIGKTMLSPNCFAFSRVTNPLNYIDMNKAKCTSLFFFNKYCYIL